MIDNRRRGATRRDVLKAGAGLTVLPLAWTAGCSGEEPAAPASEPTTAPEPSQQPPAATPPAAAPPADAAPAAPQPDLAQLDEGDPAATALGYRHDATEVDTAAYPRRAGDAGAAMFCSNCALYQARDGDWGACSIFPGKLVNANGWCNAWAPTG